MNEKEKWEEAEQLREAADNSSQELRNIYLFFLLLGTYVAVIIGSTTDEQLLKISPVTLPLLDVRLPIVAFYVLVPWLLVLLHFNLLLQLYLLSEKLHAWEKTIHEFSDEASWQKQLVRLYPFPFNHMLIGKHHDRLFRWLFGVVVWVTVILLPLSLLLWAQMRFLPYHDVTVTWAQRGAVYLDLVLLLVFWPKIVEPDGNARRWWGRLLVCPLLEWMKLRSRKTPARGIITLLLVTTVAFATSTLIATVPGESIEVWTLQKVPKFLIYRRSGAKTQESLYATYLLFDLQGSLFNRNLRLANKVLVGSELGPTQFIALKSKEEAVRKQALDQVVGLNLENRNLSFADFRRAVLPKATLSGADLAGAALGQANLLQANLNGFDPQGQKCQGILIGDKSCLTNLQGADLQGTQLQGAELEYARLQGADLGYAQLQDAKLHGAQLQGAKLFKANFQGADLSDVNFQRTYIAGANFEKAALSNANLKEARLGGFEDPILDEGNLYYPPAANLHGADLRHANLQKADLFHANLEGADLRYADLQGTDLRYAARITPEQVMKAWNWKLALYNADLLKKLGLTADHNEKVKNELAELENKGRLPRSKKVP